MLYRTTSFFCFFLVLNFKLAVCELRKGLGHKISLKTELKNCEEKRKYILTWTQVSKSVFLIVMTQLRLVKVISYLPISTY